MKLSTREDIEAPIEQVFAAISDAEGYEKLMTQRGAEIKRLNPNQEMGLGAGWDVAFRFRGRGRQLQAKVSEFEPNQALTVDTVSNGFDGAMNIKLVALSRGRTRAIVAIEIRPKTLASRLLIQSMKLAKKSITQRLSDKVAEFARNIETGNRVAA